jgi:hypothetical protein
MNKENWSLAALIFVGIVIVYLTGFVHGIMFESSDYGTHFPPQVTHGK